MRTFFGEIAAGPRGPALQIACYDDSHNTLILGLVLFTLYLKIPLLVSDGYDIERAYGFSFTNDSLHMHWGSRTKVWWYPWTWEHYKHWELVEGESYAQGRDFWIELPSRMPHGQLATKHTAPYTYKRRNGEVQNVTATYYVSHSEWRCRWAQWLPFPRKTRTSIWIEFSAEIGEGVDTWKGGTLGCGYDLLPGEKPLDCLRRMESERRFER